MMTQVIHAVHTAYSTKSYYDSNYNTDTDDTVENGIVITHLDTNLLINYKYIMINQFIK